MNSEQNYSQQCKQLCEQLREQLHKQLQEQEQSMTRMKICRNMCLSKHLFACVKIQEMKKVIEIPTHIQEVYLKSLDYNVVTCPVCLGLIQSIDNTHLTNCGHTLCKSCHQQLLIRKITKCPVCLNPVMNLDKDKWYEELGHITEQLINYNGTTDFLFSDDNDEYGYKED